MKNIFMEKKFLEYRLNGFLVLFQVWIYETIPAIARKNYCMKHESQRPQMLSWSSNQHVTSVGLRTTIFDLIKLDVNQIVPLEAEKGEEYVVGLFVEDLERRIQSNPIENRLKDVEERIKTNEEVMERLQILECKVEKMLAGNEGQMKDSVESLPNETDQMLAGNKEEMKDGMESLPDETDQVYNDFPSFSLGIEFELSCGEKDVEVAVRKNDKSVEKSDKTVEKSLRAVVKSDTAVEMNLNEEIEFHEDDWLKVDDIVARSLAKNQEDVASPCNEGRIDLLEEVELKDDVWEKVVEVTAAIEAETEIEEGNVRIIDINNETPDMYLKRQKKSGVLLQSPWVNEFNSTSGTKKRVVKSTFAFPVGVGPPMAHDVDAFELWFNKGLVKKN
ncbi:Hypothetical predicted protein [Olea europaea subsp. europaea]|uniref:Uncharacterized protein n=1 Tax=Olea europaea subsp. europaea TaxID=158383 RepID=A0A8S0SU35_OLEEU|nr:Hypothetical predicted protein [Olea europaea subsp. europaea]